MVEMDTAVLDAPETEEVTFPAITMDDRDAHPGDGEDPRPGDPPPADQTDPSNPPASGSEDGEEGDIKPGDQGMGDSTQ